MPITDPYSFMVYDTFNKKGKSQFAPLDGFIRWTDAYNIVLSRFRLINLPSCVPEYRIERYFCECNFVGAAMSPKYGLLVLPSNGAGQIDFYGQPTRWTLQGVGYTGTYLSDNVEICRTNKSDGVPLHTRLRSLIERIAKVQRTIDNYSIRMAQPYVYSGEKDAKPTYEAVTDKIAGDELLLYTSKKTQKTLESGYLINPIANGTGAGLEVLMRYKTELVNEWCNLVGIDTVNVLKKERLITDEAESNNEYVNQHLSYDLNIRQEFWARVNAHFGTNIEVRLNETLNY